MQSLYERIYNRLEDDISKSIFCSKLYSTLSPNNIIIDVVRLDDVLNSEKATFIKMDIEGAELEALKGTKQTIIKHRPKLAISVYHKFDHILKIPEFLLSLVDDYKLYLRHYSLTRSETVLYAV